MIFVNSEAPPQRLYKFVESAFVKSFLDGSSIRVGTLSDFNRLEHGGNKTDQLEGRISFGGPGTAVIGDKPVMGIRNATFHFGQSTGPAIVYQLPNHYVFCTSTELDPLIAADLDAKYDACIEILTPEPFLRSLEIALTTQGGVKAECLCGPIEYTNRRFGPHDFENADLHLSAFRKECKFAVQKEYRLAAPCHQHVGPSLFKVSMDDVEARQVIGWR